MTLLPDVGYRAETPLAMSGSANSAFSSALSSGMLRLVLLPFRFFFCANGASGSPSSSESLCVSRTFGAMIRHLHARIDVEVHCLSSLLQPISVVLVLFIRVMRFLDFPRKSNTLPQLGQEATLNRQIGELRIWSQYVSKQNEAPCPPRPSDFIRARCMPFSSGAHSCRAKPGFCARAVRPLR